MTEQSNIQPVDMIADQIRSHIVHGSEQSAMNLLPKLKAPNQVFNDPVQDSILGDTGNTLLQYAISRKMNRMVKALLDNPATNIHLAQTRGRPPLFTAIDLDNPEAVSMLAAHPRMRMQISNTFCGQSPLTRACLPNNFRPAAIRALLQNGCNPNLKDDGHRTSLDHLAVTLQKTAIPAQEKLDLITLMKEAGAVSSDADIAGLTQAFQEKARNAVVDHDPEDNKFFDYIQQNIQQNRDSGAAKFVARLRNPNRTFDTDDGILKDNGNTLLQYAISQKLMKFMDALLARPDIDLEKPQSRGRPPLFTAIDLKRPSAVRKLVQHPNLAFKINDEMYHGQTPLSRACRAQNFQLETIEALLEPRLVDPNMPDRDGITPIEHLAATYKSTFEPIYVAEAMRKLVAKGAQLPAGPEGEAIAKIMRDTPMLSESNRRDPKDEQVYDKILAAIADGQDAASAKLVPELSNPNWHFEHDDGRLNDGGNTLLQYAISSNMPKLLDALLDHPEIDIHKAQTRGRTPLFTAIDLDQQEAVTKLVNHPQMAPKINDRVMHGQTPLIRVCMASNFQPEMIPLLLQCPQTDPNKSDPRGHTPLHYLVETIQKVINREKGVESIRLLVSKGAKPYAGGQSSPLALCEKQRSEDALNAFLDAIKDAPRPEEPAKPVASVAPTKKTGLKP